MFDGKELRLAKRKSLLQVEQFSEFFNLQQLYPSLCAKGLLLQEAMQKDYPGVPFILYGELCGGAYPKAEDPSVASPVQEGVWYSPHLEYFAFDLLLMKHSLQWMGDSALRSLMARVGILSPPLLGKGSYQSMMRLSEEFESRVPALLSLPAIPANWAEGLVLKPAATWSGERPLIKRKRYSFAEQDAAAPPLNSALPAGLVMAVSQGINRQRMQSAHSKLGNVSGETIVQEALADIFSEVQEEYGEVSNTEKAQLEQLMIPALQSLIDNFQS
jgi:hypothetical protein